MIGVERARFLELLARGGVVALAGERLRFADELLHERRGLGLFARLLVEHARVVVGQVLGQQLGGEVENALEIAAGHGRARLAQPAVVGRCGKQRVDVDRGARIARFFQQLLRRIEHRIHPENQSAALDDFVDSSLLEERDRLLKRGENTFLHRRR